MRRSDPARATAGTVPWGSAAAAVGLLAAVLMLALQARPIVAKAVWSWRMASETPTWLAGPATWGRLVGWALVVAALAAGLRAAAAVGASAALLAEIGVVAVGIGRPIPGWRLLLAAVVAVLLCWSLLSGTNRYRLPGRTVALLAAMGTGAALAAAGQPLAIQRLDGFLVVETRTLAAVGIATLLWVALLGLAAMTALPKALRRRTLVLLVTVAVLLATVQLGYDGGFASAMPHPLIDSPAAALALAVLGAATVLTAGALAVRLGERPGE